MKRRGFLASLFALPAAARTLPDLAKNEEIRAAKSISPVALRPDAGGGLHVTYSASYAVSLADSAKWSSK